MNILAVEIIGAIAGVITLFILPVLFLVKLMRRYDAKAEKRLNELMTSRSIVNGHDTKRQVNFYVKYGILHWSKSLRLTFNVTIENVDALILLCSDLRSFALRWGLFANGILFNPLITWWNYSRALKTLESFKYTIY
jgi:hypothetical protein